jgi:hypothetical protein
VKDIPHKTFSDIKGELPPIERVLMYCTGLMLVLFFAVTFIANPAITGNSVVGSATGDTARFAGSSSILLVIFAAFALFLFIITKRLRMQRSV